jgi:hypothetical protein
MSDVTLDDVMNLATKLSSEDKARLIERLSQTIQQEIEAQPRKSRQSAYGMWSDYISISAEEIDELRREMWKNFPREDI